MVNKFGVKSGDVLAKRYSNSNVVALVSGAAIAVDANKGELFSLTPGANATLTVAGGKNGQNLALIITTTGTTSRTLTFGTGFKVTGTLATGTTAAKVFSLMFKNVNGTFYEIARSTAM
jgi:hypothetical protein